MKKLHQIKRYISHCKFPDDDWQKVLAYCRERFSGGKVHRALSPISESTYEQFKEWLGTGLGSGDMISYGKTMGVIKTCTPEVTILAAYCDYDCNLIVKDMKVQNVERLKYLDLERQSKLRTLMYNSGYYYAEDVCTVIKMYTPKENYYVSYNNDITEVSGIGMYSKSDNNKYYFLAFLDKDGLHLNYEIDINCTPLCQITDKEKARFHKALEKAGLTFNVRLNKLVKIPPRGNNKYWYLNECFEIVQDKDTGGKRHSVRYDAGNYFTDYTQAILFMQEVKKIRGVD